MKLVIAFFSLSLIVLIYSNHNDPVAHRSPSVTGFENWKNGDDYVFKYTYKNESLTIKSKIKDAEAAFEKSAIDCFNHFIESAKTEDEQITLIDICANPR